MPRGAVRAKHAARGGAHLLGAVEAEQLGVGGLVGLEVLAGGLAEFLGRGGDVQNVVGYLEGETYLLGVELARLDLGVVGACEDGARADGGLEERAGLVVVDPLKRVEAHLLPPRRGTLALEVHHLATGEPDGADGLAQDAQHGDDALGGDASSLARDVLK